MAFATWLSKFKSAHARLTLSRVTIAFLLLAFVQTLVQLALYSVALADDVATTKAAQAILVQAPEDDICHSALPVLEGTTLRVCDRVPSLPGANCNIVVDILLQSRADKTEPRRPEVALQCQRAMVLPKEIFIDAQREDVVTLFYQIWLFVVSLRAVLNDSIPHMVAQLLGHTLNTAWAAYRVRRIWVVHRAYSYFIVNGACGGINVLDDAWDHSMEHAIAVVAVSSAMLIATGILSAILLRRYLRQTFNRVGASSQIMRMYKLSMLFSVSLHGSFFLIAAVVLWISKLATEPYHKATAHVKVYEGIAGTALILLPVWVILGHYFVCLECPWRFCGFLAIGSFVLAERVAATAKPEFAFAIHLSPFFATISIAALVCLVAALILACACRVNFGKGLKQYMAVQAMLTEDGFAPGVFGSSSFTSASAHTSWLPVAEGNIGYPTSVVESATDRYQDAHHEKEKDSSSADSIVVVTLDPGSVETPPPLSSLSAQLDASTTRAPSPQNLLAPPGLALPTRVQFNGRRALASPFPTRSPSLSAATPAYSPTADPTSAMGRPSTADSERQYTTNGRRPSTAGSRTSVSSARTGGSTFVPFNRITGGGRGSTSR